MCSHRHISQRYFNHNRLCVTEVCQAVNRDVTLFFLILWCVCMYVCMYVCVCVCVCVVFGGFLKFVICCDLFSYSK